jgi:hypothetical protein
VEFILKPTVGITHRRAMDSLASRAVGVFLNFRRIDYKSRAKNSKLLSFVSRCVTGVAINLRL